MINQEWKIKGRAHVCSVTGQPFVENEPFYTALFEDESDEDGFIRRDYCVAAWQQERPNLRPFSHWRSLYEPPQSEPARRDVVEKEGAESLLRRLIEEDDPLTENTRFILALMLERKKTLRETDSRSLGTARLRIYEHAKSGEVFIIRDPQLKLDQLESIQHEVAERLSARQQPHPAHSQDIPSQEIGAQDTAPHDTAAQNTAPQESASPVADSQEAAQADAMVQTVPEPEFPPGDASPIETASGETSSDGTSSDGTSSDGTTSDISLSGDSTPPTA